MTVVAIIPARAGSKRLPGKNLLALHGRPLLEYTCAAAMQSGVLDAVYINTDSVEIAEAAAQSGVRCPRLRPPQLATDSATTRDAMLFMLDELTRRGEHYDAAMILQPTSPLRTAEDIRAAWQLFEENAPCAVVSVSPLVRTAWAGNIARDGQFEPLTGHGTLVRLNGAIYVHPCADYVIGSAPRKTVAYAMPVERGVDIDTPEDFQFAEFLLSRGAHV